MQAGQFRILIRRSGKQDTGFGRFASMLRLSDPKISIIFLKDELKRSSSTSASFYQTLKAFTYDSGVERTLDQAIYVAGESRVRKVALASAMLTASPAKDRLILLDLDSYRRRCVTMAALLESLAQRYKEDSADIAFNTGLLMDAGYLVMIDHGPNELQQALFKITNSSNPNVLDIERQQIGIDHTELGVVIAEEFGMPEEVVKGIEFHHRPLEAPEKFRYWCSLCHLASWLVDNLGLRIAKGMPAQTLVQEAFEEIKNDPDYEDHISSSVKFAAGMCDDAVRKIAA